MSINRQDVVDVVEFSFSGSLDRLLLLQVQIEEHLIGESDWFPVSSSESLSLLRGLRQRERGWETETEREMERERETERGARLCVPLGFLVQNASVLLNQLKTEGSIFTLPLPTHTRPGPPNNSRNCLLVS